MDKNLKNVFKWYSEDQSLTEMKMANGKGLKTWEKEIVASYFKKNDEILDVGCGMGRETFKLYDMGYILTGVDISEKAVKLAEQFAAESNRNITFLQTDGVNLPFEDSSFDVVIIWSQTMGIIYSENRKLDFLKECNRVLRKGGIISYSGHDCEYLEMNYPHCLQGNKFFPYKNADIYWEMFTVDDIKEMAKKAGFEILDARKGNIYKEEDGTIVHCVGKK